MTALDVIHLYRGMRSGTVPAPLVVGLGAACEVCSQELQYDSQHVKRLSSRLVNGITSQISHVIRNGDTEQNYPGSSTTSPPPSPLPYFIVTFSFSLGCVNFSFAFVEGESMLMAMKDVALSSGRCLCRH